MRLRQVALVARDLATTAEQLCDVFGVEVGFRDPGVGHFGLHNVVIPIGDTFLEVVSPKEDGTTAGRYLERRGGDGGYMVLVQVDDQQEARARVERLGVRVVWQADRETISGTHLHPADVGGAILSLDQAHPAESWEWGGPAWRDHVQTASVSQISGVAIQAADPTSMAARWSEVLGVPAQQDARGQWHIPFVDTATDSAGVVRFVDIEDGRGEGVSEIDLKTVDARPVVERARALGLETGEDHVCLGGVSFRL